MIVTPLKDAGIHLSSETLQCSLLQNAVFLESLPSDTLIPVKDLVKYQKSSSKWNSHKKNQLLEITTSNNKNIFHSTMLTEACPSNSSLDISVIMPNMDRLRNEMTYESPGKIFQRMKEKVQRDKQDKPSRNSSMMGSPKWDHKVLPPDRHKKTLLQDTYICEEKENSFQSSNPSLGDPPVLNQEEKRVSISCISSKALTRAQFNRQDLYSKENPVKTTVSKKNTFVLEGINSTYEKIENTDGDNICVPIENHSQSITAYNDVTTERTAKEDITEQNEETMSRRTFLQDPMKNTSKMTCSSPRLYLTLSGQSQKQLTELETIAREVKKYQVVQLQEWMIKVSSNNTAICVQGKLVNMTDVYWHSNIIVERIKHNKLRTLSGTIYILKGLIDRVSMKEAGFPHYLTWKFMFGFPQNWKEHIDNFLEQLRAGEKNKPGQKTARFQDKQKSIKNHAEDIQTDVFQKANITYDLTDDSLEMKKNQNSGLPGAAGINTRYKNSCRKKPQEFIGKKNWRNFPSESCENCKEINEKKIQSQKQDRTEVLNVPIDSLNSLEQSTFQKERRYLPVGQKKAIVLVTPLRTTRSIKQRYMEHHLYIKGVRDFSKTKHQEESESEIHRTPSPTSKSSETCEHRVDCEDDTEEDCNDRDIMTVRHTHIPCLPSKQMLASDFKKKNKLPSKLQKTENQIGLSKYSQSSSEQNGVEIKSKTRARKTKERLNQERKNIPKDILLISESKGESDSYITPKRPRSVAKGSHYKAGGSMDFLIEAKESATAKRQWLDHLPGVTDDGEWSEPELQKLHRTTIHSKRRKTLADWSPKEDCDTDSCSYHSKAEESQVMGTGNLQSTMLEGRGMNLPDLDLSAIDDKVLSRKASRPDSDMTDKAKSTSFASCDKKRTLRKKRRDLQETMDMMGSQTLLMTLLSVKMENNLALLEEKAEKDLAAMFREKERLQRQALELRRQLLLRQKQQELAAALDAQIEVLSPLQPVLERFKEEYKTLGRALDTTRHELPVQAVHTEGSGQGLLDDLEPALRTTVQLLGDLSICSPDTSAQVQGASAQVQGASAQVQGASAQVQGASAQVQGASAQEPGASAQLDYLLKELKALVTEKDLELSRLVSEVVELSSQASKEAALTNQEVWEEAEGTVTSSQWYFSPRACRDHSPGQDRINDRPDP